MWSSVAKHYFIVEYMWGIAYCTVSVHGYLVLGYQSGVSGSAFMEVFIRRMLEVVLISNEEIF